MPCRRDALVGRSVEAQEAALEEVTVVVDAPIHIDDEVIGQHHGLTVALPVEQHHLVSVRMVMPEHSEEESM